MDEGRVPARQVHNAHFPVQIQEVSAKCWGYVHIPGGSLAVRANFGTRSPKETPFQRYPRPTRVTRLEHLDGMGPDTGATLASVFTSLITFDNGPRIAAEASPLVEHRSKSMPPVSSRETNSTTLGRKKDRKSGCQARPFTPSLGAQ